MEIRRIFGSNFPLHEWKDKTGNKLALAIWKYLSDYETGLYHFNEILEGPDPFDEYATVRDPLKILNTYNMAYCGSQSCRDKAKLFDIYKDSRVHNLEIIHNGEAEVTFEVFTPYIIVPKVNDLDDPNDDKAQNIGPCRFNRH